jgi:hypothetical protein
VEGCEALVSPRVDVLRWVCTWISDMVRLWVRELGFGFDAGSYTLSTSELIASRLRWCLDLFSHLTRV